MRKLLFRIYRVLPVRLRWMISHRLASKFVVGIIAFAVRDDELLLLEHRYQDAWALPGGWLRAGESIEGSIAREIREETGLDARVVRICEVTSVVEKPVIDIAVECALGDGELRPDGAEVVRARFFPMRALPSDILSTHAPYIERFLCDRVHQPG